MKEVPAIDFVVRMVTLNEEGSTVTPDGNASEPGLVAITLLVATFKNSTFSS